MSEVLPNTLTLSICQFPIAFLDWDSNEKQAISYIKSAKNSHSDLIIFPEMTLTGIAGEIEPMADTDNRNIRFFTKLAMEHSIAIGFGWGKPAGEKLENHYTVIGPDGTILSDYVKIHPFTYGGEDKCFVSGNEIHTFEYRGFQICTLICYDMRFPELFQAASKSADLITLCANWPERRNEHWKILSQARAIENQVYFAACNCVGEINRLKYSGDSSLYHPDGKILGRLSHTDGLITCTITNDVASVRKAFPVKQDRHIDLYKSIL